MSKASTLMSSIVTAQNWHKGTQNTGRKKHSHTELFFSFSKEINDLQETFHGVKQHKHLQKQTLRKGERRRTLLFWIKSKLALLEQWLSLFVLLSADPLGGAIFGEFKERNRNVNVRNKETKNTATLLHLVAPVSGVNLKQENRIYKQRLSFSCFTASSSSSSSYHHYSSTTAWHY